MRTAYYWVNGINNRNEGADDTGDKIEYWIEENCPDSCCVQVFHDCGPLSAWFKLGRIVREIVSRSKARAAYRQVWIGHSFGTRAICDALRVEGVHFDEVHLIAGAAHESFVRNGLNDAILADRVGRVFVHWSDSDHVLRRLAGLTPLLYGRLGYKGPKDVAAIKEIVRLQGESTSSFGQRLARRAEQRMKILRVVEPVYWRDTGHCGYFKDPNFPTLMRFITERK